LNTSTPSTLGRTCKCACCCRILRQANNLPLCCIGLAVLAMDLVLVLMLVYLRLHQHTTFGQQLMISGSSSLLLKHTRVRFAGSMPCNPWSSCTTCNRHQHSQLADWSRAASRCLESLSASTWCNRQQRQSWQRRRMQKEGEGLQGPYFYSQKTLDNGRSSPCRPHLIHCIVYHHLAHRVSNRLRRSGRSRLRWWADGFVERWQLY
jgi:hypothetical protein